MTDNNLCKSCINLGCEFQSGIVRTKCAFYMPPYREKQMGMSIDEHKEHLLDIMDSMPDDACGDWRDSLAYAIETMRKYQKIVQIMERTVDDGTSMYDTLQEIEEVVEDDNT